LDQNCPPECITRFCGECGYRLQGLPSEGACPECGTAYDSDRIVIAGWGSGRRASVANAPPDRLVIVLLLSVLYLLVLGVYRLIRRRPYEALISFVWAAIFAGLEILNRRRVHGGGDIPCHARLYPTGFGQRDGFGPCDLHPWSTADKIILEPTSNGRYRIEITSKTVAVVPVAIEFECTDQQAEWLRAAIERFRKPNS
jgi:hypothetical protein